MKRSSALLAHISSIPGPFGQGTMGPEAHEFGEFLVDAGFTYWQILPLGQPAIDSPYMCLSAFAGNSRLIDPRLLEEDGLLTAEEVRSFQYTGNEHRADFGFVHNNSRAFLDLAFRRLSAEQNAGMARFEQSQFWLKDYALFMVIREHFNNEVWWNWKDKALAAHDAEALEAFEAEHKTEIQKQIFIQWIFSRQWTKLKGALNLMGLGIYGDMPYYVGRDSADVWAHKEMFALNKNFKPREVAGVPPDYFSEDGQLWGFPVYDWEYLKNNDYSWWIERIKFELNRYDLLRIDHFRGLSAYWCVPYGKKTARIGKWRKGPGMDLFRHASARLGELPIIAEDLGVVDDDLLEFLDESGFPRMKVLQFSLDPGIRSSDLPHDYPRNCCAYTGTHDNNTSLGWLWEATEDVRMHALDYCAFPEGEDWGKGGVNSLACHSFIRTVWASTAILAVAPIQDFLGFGSDARMNLPSTEAGCWQFRVTEDQLRQLDSRKIFKLNALYQRNKKFELLKPEPTLTSLTEDKLT